MDTFADHLLAALLPAPERPPRDSAQKLVDVMHAINTYRPRPGAESMIVLTTRPLLRFVRLPDSETIDALLDVAREQTPLLLGLMKSDPNGQPTPVEARPALTDADAS